MYSWAFFAPLEIVSTASNYVDMSIQSLRQHFQQLFARTPSQGRKRMLTQSHSADFLV